MFKIHSPINFKVPFKIKKFILDIVENFKFSKIDNTNLYTKICFFFIWFQHINDLSIKFKLCMCENFMVFEKSILIYLEFFLNENSRKSINMNVFLVKINLLKI
mmetsp:Transcript_90798/g.146890  ORF Transcript_90798/g.146890 Transcript_90798/m.146890 type:complete len:104 (-) Transcript_90798:1430-1741(-)